MRWACGLILSRVTSGESFDSIRALSRSKNIATFENAISFA
jgi:hypothetical protein